MRIHAAFVRDILFVLVFFGCRSGVTVEKSELGQNCSELRFDPGDTPCVDIYDCPNDCNFYVCNFGQCVVTAEKEEGMRCNLECEDAPAFCRAGECTAGCDYALDCPRPPACVMAICSNNECSYSHQNGCTPN